LRDQIKACPPPPLCSGVVGPIRILTTKRFQTSLS